MVAENTNTDEHKPTDSALEKEALQVFSAMERYLEESLEIEHQTSSEDTRSSSQITRYRLECDYIYEQLIAETKQKLGKPNKNELYQQFYQILKNKDHKQALVDINDLILSMPDDAAHEDLLSACKKIQFHLQLRNHIDTWSEEVKKSKEPLITIKQQIENTFGQMLEHSNEAHPSTVNFLFRAQLEANSWLELKQMLAQLKQLEVELGDSRFFGNEKQWQKAQVAYFRKVREIARDFCMDMDYLLELTEKAHLLASKPFSIEWFLKQSETIDSSYLNHKDLTLTDNAKKRIQTLILEALNPYAKEAAIPRKISQQDLTLLAHYLGRSNLHKFSQRYALYGDGTDDHPFDMDNLRAVLVGMAANRDKDSESSEIKQVLDGVTAQCCNPEVGLGASPRMLYAFLNRSQNSLPENKIETSVFLGVELPRFWSVIAALGRLTRQYIASTIRTSKERFAASALVQLNMPVFIATSALFAVLTSEEIHNDPLNKYSNDLACLQAQRTLQRTKVSTSKIKTGQRAVEEIINNLKSSVSYTDFCELYPMFSKENAHVPEADAIEAYFLEGKPDPVPELVQNLISQKVTDIDRLARSQMLSFDLAYEYIKGKEQFIVELQDRDLNTMKFQGKNIIRPETGFGMDFYSPAEGQEIYNNTIPLMITFPGTHNQMGILRDFETRSPGQAEWDSKENRQIILTALNEEIGRLTNKYPGATVSIEALGHSLGGSDALHMELLIMEAMAQNLNDSNNPKIREFRKKVEHLFSLDDEAHLNELKKIKAPTPEEKTELDHLKYKQKTKEQLIIGLESALGTINRSSDTLLDKDKDKNIDSELRSNLTQAKISMISVYCDRGSGYSQEENNATAALMGLLSDQTKINQDCLDVEGDPVRMIGTAKYYGTTLLDPNLELFKDNKNIKLNSINFKTGYGFRKWGFLTNYSSSNQLAVVQGHTGEIFGGNRYGADIGFKSGDDPEEYTAFKNEITGRVFKADWAINRAWKWIAHNGSLFARVLFELALKYPVLVAVPIIFDTVFLSFLHNASYDSIETTERTKRNKLNQMKQTFEELARIPSADEHSAFDRSLLATPKIDINLIDANLNEQLASHLKHQLLNAKQYLARWQTKANQLPDSTNEAERMQLITEIEHQVELVNLLNGCFKDPELNELSAEGCMQLILALKIEDDDLTSYIEERNPKTLSLETKAMIPIILAMQKQKLEDLKEQRTGIFATEAEQQLESNIQNYQDFLKQDELLSRRVMSSSWLNQVSLRIVEPPDWEFKITLDEQQQIYYQEHNPLLELAGNGTFTITPAGLEHLQLLFTRALGEPLNNEPLNEEDLALLGHYYGRRTVKKVMDRYSLKGDGTSYFPFSLDNLRSLMVGATLFQNTDYLQEIPQDHREHLLKTNQTTTDAVTNPKKQIGALKRIIDNFQHYEQNELGDSLGGLKYYMSFGRGLQRFYNFIINFVLTKLSYASTSNLTSPSDGNLVPLIITTAAVGVNSVLSMVTPDNPSSDNFMHDLKQLYFTKRANELVDRDSEASHSHEDRNNINKLMEDIVNSLPQPHSQDLKKLNGFFSKYPMFTCNQEIFQRYVTAPEDHEVETEVIELIKKRVTQIIDWGRAEQIAKMHSRYISDGTSTKVLMDRHGNELLCNATSVTDTDVPYFKFNCFWPQQAPAHDEPIPLIITIPEEIGSGNIWDIFAPLTKSAEQFRAGHQRLEEGAISMTDRWAYQHRLEVKNPDNKVSDESEFLELNTTRREQARHKIIAAINTQIEAILEKHPGKKISIELFGQGIAASHSHQLELYIMEALAAHQLKNEDRDLNFKKNLYGTDASFYGEDRCDLNERMFRQGNDPAPSITKANIVGIHTYAFSGVGESTYSAKERANLADYLAGEELKIAHNSFRIEGDATSYLREDNADLYLNEFKNKDIEINHATTQSGLGLKDGGWFINRFMKGDFSDLIDISGKFSGPSRMHTNTAIVSEGSTELRDVLKEECMQSQQAGIAPWVGYAAIKSFMWSILYPIHKATQVPKWLSCIVRPITVNAQEFCQNLFSIKGIDAQAGKQAQKEQEDAEEVISKVSTEHSDEVINQFKR